MNDESVIDFSTLEIISKTGEFYYQLGLNSTRVIKTDEETFKNMLVATARTYQRCKQSYGDDSIQVHKALRTYKFYEDQIDLTKGDMFSALLYPFDKWVAMQ